MKRFLTGCAVLLILYVVAYDLKVGTLPQSTPANAEIQAEYKENKPYKLYEVTPGDTLLSVVEKLNMNGNYSITTMIKDFKSLNPGVDPEHIQLGKSYKIPVYDKSER